VFDKLPADAMALADAPWSDLEPYYTDLAARELSAGNVEQWLTDWSHLSERIWEAFSRLQVATTVDTTDETARKRFERFLEELYPVIQKADHALDEKLLASGLEPVGMAIPLRNMRTEAALFREANLPLFVEERKIGSAYDRVVGAQTVTWEGEERTIAQLDPLIHAADRPVREQLWRLAAERRLADREAINDLWVKLLDLRGRIAENTGFTDYRGLRWQQLLRFDYTPENCESFHAAIEEVVVPAATRLYARGRERLGVDTLRPWDLKGPQGHSSPLDPPGAPPLHPYQTIDELIGCCQTIFNRVDRELGAYFATMVRDGLLDLDNRKGKAPGGYCTSFPTMQRPFIFMNAVGIHDDVQTLLHESGHAFHVFETAGLPYIHQKGTGSEFAEVASMSMELLGAPYLVASEGGFYSEIDAARARAEHLREIVFFWPYMAVVDGFQHWAYTHQQEARDPARCDAAWLDLWRRFMRGVDWSGLEDVETTGWHRKLHIFRHPFYYIEYGLARLGAVQVWHNSLADQAGAVRAYRKGLSLGGTAPFPELFAATGARFAFDADTLRMAVDLVEGTLDQLETTIAQG
jgi:oligoendopeptidase F